MCRGSARAVGGVPTPPHGSLDASTNTGRSARRRPDRRARPRSEASAQTAEPVRRPQSKPRRSRSRRCPSSCSRRAVAVSRSSNRSRNSPPELRANSQAASAVRRFPMWRVPVGLGAKRPRLTRRVSRGPQPTGRTGPGCCVLPCRFAQRSRCDGRPSCRLTPSHGRHGKMRSCTAPLISMTASRWSTDPTSS